MSRLIIVVTGANSGIGFSTCERLLQQLSQTNPPDAQPQFDLPGIAGRDAEPLVSGRALTLIMACRNAKKAETARQQLYRFIDTQLASRTSRADREYGDSFRKSLRIEIESCDLSVVSSVRKCGKSLREKYPYISHLICNAGTSSVYGIDWLYAIRYCIMHPVLGVTLAPFYLQESGQRSADGLGWVWQCNVFGHYVLYRELSALLSAYTQTSNGRHSSRVLWTSSMEAVHVYHPDDWQLVETKHPYRSSKYQMDLIGSQLGQRAVEEEERTSSPAEIQHFVVHPGIALTGMVDHFIARFFIFFMLLAFYLARLLGSPHHPIQAFKGAISAVHVALVPLKYLPTTRRFPKSLVFTDVSDPALMQEVQEVSGVKWTPYPEGDLKAPLPAFRFGSESDWMGTERVGLTRVRQWKEHAEDSKVLIDRCEKLYQSFLRDEGKPADNEAPRATKRR